MLDLNETIDKNKKSGQPRRYGTEQEAYLYSLQTNTAQWAIETPILLDGKPFTFENHEYLIDEYLEDAPVEVNKKAAQLGYTTKEMLKTIHMCKFLYPNGVLYLFPTRDDVSDFSKTRFRRLLDDNPVIDSWIQNTDSANLKAIGQGFFYFRGTKSRSGAKSIPVDKIVFDEFDEHISSSSREAHELTSPELILERVSHSKFKHSSYLSTPTLPDFGIEALFATTNQKHWFIKCDHCGKWTCLELEFIASEGNMPAVLKRIETGKETIVIRACKFCSKEIYPSNGSWVALKPGIKNRHGSYISQLNSYYIEPKDLLESYETHVLRIRPAPHGKPNPQEFWNSKLGRGWVSATDRLSKEQIRACCSTFGIKQYDIGPCAMGVDQGNGLHVVILTLRMSKPAVLYIGVLSDWSELDFLMKAFNVSCCVVDALPEKRNARKLVLDYPKRVWMNYYDANKKGAYTWNEGEYTVNVDRTESLDDSHLKIANKEIVLPKDGIDVTEQFITQCFNTAKRRIEEKNGSIKYTYVKLGADHFRHAFNYACIAATRMVKAHVNLKNVSIHEQLLMSGKDWED